MSEWLIWTVTAIYVIVTISLWFSGKFGLSVTFLGYSIANIGIILSLK